MKMIWIISISEVVVRVRRKPLGGLAAALRTIQNQLVCRLEEVGRGASVTKHREQAVRASGEEVGSADASSSSSGKWADLVKRTDGSSPSGPSSSQYTSRRGIARGTEVVILVAPVQQQVALNGVDQRQAVGVIADAPVLPVNTWGIVRICYRSTACETRAEDEENSLGGQDDSGVVSENNRPDHGDNITDPKPILFEYARHTLTQHTHTKDAEIITYREYMGAGSPETSGSTPKLNDLKTKIHICTDLHFNFTCLSLPVHYLWKSPPAPRILFRRIGRSDLNGAYTSYFVPSKGMAA